MLANVVKELTQPTRSHGTWSVPQLAERLGIAPVTLYQYGEADNRRLPAEFVAPLTRITGDTLLIEYLCRECGGMFVGIPANPVKPTDAAKVIREFGEFIETWGDAFEDGRLSRSQFDEIARQGRDAIESVRGLVECARVTVSNEQARRGGVKEAI
jgi:hypothetical protein